MDIPVSCNDLEVPLQQHSSSFSLSSNNSNRVELPDFNTAFPPAETGDAFGQNVGGYEIVGVGVSNARKLVEPDDDYVRLEGEEDEDEATYKEGVNRKERMGFFSDYKWVGPIINIADWRNEYYQQLGDEYMDRSLPKIDACMVSRALQINAAIAEELIAVCDSKQIRDFLCSQLACPAQPEYISDKLTKEERIQQLEDMITDKGVGLNTLKMRKHRLSKGVFLTRDEDAYPAKFFATNLDKAQKDKNRNKNSNANSNSRIPNKIESPEAVLTIVIVRVDSPYPETFRCKVSHEIEVLSQQTLSTFRDFFPCSLDKTHFGEFSAKPNSHVKAPTYRTKFPSACLFVEGVFYDDLREPEAIKLSDTIVQWSEERERGWKGFEQSPSSMHLVTFEDLTLQLGKPYLYLHQGDCEHVWMVTSVRLYHPHDLRSYDDYPRITGVGYFHRRKCLACAQYAASWMVLNDELQSRSPSFLCDRCMKELHYDSRGKKVDDFKALHFVDPNRTNWS